MKKHVVNLKLISILLVLTFLLIPGKGIAEEVDDNKPVRQTLLWLSDPFVNTITSMTYYFDLEKSAQNSCCIEASIEIPTEWCDTGDYLDLYHDEILEEHIWVNQKKMSDYDSCDVGFITINTDGKEYRKGFICVVGFEEEIKTLTITIDKELGIKPIKEGTFETGNSGAFPTTLYSPVFLHIFPENMEEITETKRKYVKE
ncbi:MAG: hypothetical protein KAH01_00235 [Caldisericia bacterium]|nr:hypothetical protein [Caldisericia bacterium]